MNDEPTADRGRGAPAPPSCPICGDDPWARCFSGRTDFENVFGPCGCRLARIAAEEAAGQRKFEVEEREFTNPDFEAFYTEFHRPGAAVVQPWLPDEVKRAREVEAYGYYLWGARFLRGFFGATRGRKMAESRVFMYRAERPEDVPAHTIRAIRSVIRAMEPEWVARVLEARRYADDPRVMAAWCELPLQVVVAGLETLTAHEKAEDRPAG